MSDLPERLLHTVPSIHAMREAADEIIRLRNALALSIEQVKEVSAERDTLRKRIAEAPKGWTVACDPSTVEVRLDRLVAAGIDDKRVALVVLEDGEVTE